MMKNIDKKALLKHFHISSDADVFKFITQGYEGRDTNFIGVKQFISVSKEKIIKPYSIYTNFIYDFKDKKVDILPLLFDKNEFISDVGISWVYTDSFFMHFHKLGRLINLSVNDDNTLSPEFEEIITQFIVREDFKNKTLELIKIKQENDKDLFGKSRRIVVNVNDKPVKPFDKINTDIIDRQFVR